AVGLAEDLLGAIAGYHLVAVGRGAGELGLIVSLKGVSLRDAVKASKCPRSPTHDVIVGIGGRAGGNVCNIRKPVKCPFRTEIGIVEISRLKEVTLIVANGEPDRGANRRRVTDRFVNDI